MNKLLPLFSCLLLLSGCAGNNGETSPSSSASSETSSSETESKESSSTEPTLKDRLTALGEKLTSLEGQVNQTSTQMKRIFTYPSDGQFDMTVLSSRATVRYTYNDSYVVETNGTDDYGEGNTAAYKAQIYDNEKVFYKVQAYDGEVTKKEKITYSEDSVESVYDIGFVQDEIVNFNQMIALAESDENVACRLYEVKESETSLSYSYSISSFTESEGELVLSERISYDNAYTISSGLVSHLSQSYLQEKFVAQTTTKVEAYSEIDYYRGDFASFTGELLV